MFWSHMKNYSLITAITVWFWFWFFHPGSFKYYENDKVRAWHCQIFIIFYWVSYPPPPLLLSVFVRIVNTPYIITSLYILFQHGKAYLSTVQSEHNISRKNHNNQLMIYALLFHNITTHYIIYCSSLYYTDGVEGDRTETDNVLCDLHVTPLTLQSRDDDLIRWSVWSFCRLYEIILLSVWYATR